MQSSYLRIESMTFKQTKSGVVRSQTVNPSLPLLGNCRPMKRAVLNCPQTFKIIVAAQRRQFITEQ